MTRGRIAQLNVSRGGAPKLPVPRATVTLSGLEGDAQRSPRHGGPLRALMLYSMEQIAALRTAGHPIVPGAVGENVTTEDIDLASIRPGDQLRLGQDVLLEITLYPTPCDGIGHAFLGRDFMQVAQERHPGMSRLAGRVLHGGELVPGDLISLVVRAPRELGEPQ